VESCTALVEHADGRFELIDWAQENRLSFPRGTTAPPPPAVPAPGGTVSTPA
jgi:hypothetical protein